MPKVDVIIPAYNAAHFLPSAIESVMSQSFEDWRIVLVDDGSTDDTADVAAGYAKRLGEKLLYIRQENAGLPAARNTAIKNSSAEFLALLDADDVWLPQRLEESLRCFEGHPETGLSYGLIAQIDMDGVVRQTFDRRRRHPAGKIAPQIYMRTMDLPCPTVTFRRSCVDRVGMFDESMRATEDRDLWVRIALVSEVAVVPRVIAQYRVSPNAMTTDPARMLTAQLRFVEKHYGSEGCGFRARRVALSKIYRQHAEALASRGQAGAALRSGLRAAVLYPFQMNNVRTAGSLVLRWVLRRG